MSARQFILPIAAELIVDLFAGGGGASAGIELATGRHVDIAVNHDRLAISLHQVNHPQTRHFCSDVFEVDPVEVCGSQPVGLLWASPDCKHFSKAKGGQPRSKKIRSLADVVITWGERKRPRLIVAENVEEFQDWGDLDDEGRPDPACKGQNFQRWVAALRALGYVVEYRLLRACDYGVPTIRKRLFVIARCDGLPIVWPEKTHGPNLRPYRTAADVIDWSLHCPSIFERKRELVPATLRRIAHGIRRYVLDTGKPFIVPITHTSDDRVQSCDQPLRTVTSAKGGEFALAAPTLIEIGYGERAGQAPRAPGLGKPLGTIVGTHKHALVAAYLAKHFGGEPAPGKTCSSLAAPAPTVTARDHSALTTAHLVKLRGTGTAVAAVEPLHTVSAQGQHHAVVTSQLLAEPSPAALAGEPRATHQAEVRALLLKYYGTDQDPRLDEPLHTVTTKDRFGIVTVDCIEYAIVDIGMRMLQPRELFRAQGFADSYVIDRDGAGRPLSKEAQVRMCGNSVCPPLASAIVAANFVEVDMRVAA